VKIKRIIIIVPLLLLALAIAGGFVWLWRIFVFLVVIFSLNYLWMSLCVRAIDGKVKQPPDFFRTGECFEEEFTVSNSSRFPAPIVEVNEETDLPGYRNALSISLPPRDSCYWRSKVICRRRGVYLLGRLAVKITDPLGLFSVKKYLGEHHEIIIYPEMLELPFFQALPSRELGQSPRRWLASETSPVASRVRDYTIGDSLRHIHWHTTAHTGKLMVREFDPDRSSYNFKSLWIIPDMHKTMSLGTGDETTEEYAIKIAASLARKYLTDGKKVGLIAAGDHSYLSLPETGNEHLKSEGELPLDILFTSQIERFEAGSVAIVIMLSNNHDMIAPLRQAISRGVIVVAVLLDSSSFGAETGAENTARALISNGVHVYIMKRGAEVTRALDSRMPIIRV
jgi:uncharacterized protein (DUF58 family)